jgi:ATP-dependent exoDNAse (exonuclease V) alpha subunit
MDKVTKFKARTRNVAYTSVTRAKTSLAVYHDGALPGYLEKGLDRAKGVIPDRPKLDDLFKKR